MYYNDLIRLATKSGIIVLVTNSLGNIGTIYKDKKEYDKAEKYYKKSIDIALSTRNMENLRWIHKDVSDMYRSVGDFKKVYYHYIQYNLYNDSLNNMKFEQGLSEARMKFDVDQQQKEVEVLTLKLSQQRYFTYAAVALIMLFILVGLLVIRQFRLSVKRRISEMNHKIAGITQANLRFKDKFSYNIELNDEIDTLQYRIPTMLIQPYVENTICHRDNLFIGG